MWEEVIKFCKYYSSIIFDVVCDAKHEKRLKILTSKQMLQKLPIAFAQVKADNTSENLLNEIRQVINYLCGAKLVTKKYITI